jgi:hypothetical protein
MPPPVRLAAIIGVGLAVALALLIQLVASRSIQAAGVIYMYVQQDGTVVYTEQWDQIPSAYRDKVRSLDGDTLEPIASTAAAAQAVTRPVTPARRADRSTPPQESWGVMAQYLSPILEKLQAMNLTLPSHTQLGITLTMFAFIAATFSILRMTENRLAKAAIKAALMLMIAGSVYAIFLSDLAQTFVTEAGAPPAASPGGNTARAAASQNGGRNLNPLSTLTRSIQETRDASLDKATQAAGAMNAANRHRESTIAGLEPDANGDGPRSSADAIAPTSQSSAAKPQSPSPRQSHETIVHRVKDAAATINQNYQEIERTDRTLAEQPPDR